MAINLLGQIPKPTTTYSSLTPKANTYSSLSSAPVGVTAKSPTTNVTPPATTLPASQQVIKPSTTQPLASAPIQNPNAGLLAQSTLAAQNAAKAIGGSYTTSGGYVPGASSTTSTTNPAPSTQTPIPSTTPVQTPAATPTFGGLLGQAASQAGLINNTASQLGTQGQMTPEEIAARTQLAQLTADQSTAMTNLGQQGWSTLDQAGQAGLIQRNAQAQQQALADKVAAYAAERTANTTAYTGQANAQNQAGGLLNTAASTASPQLGQYGQSYYSPLNAGQTSTNAGVQPSDPYYQTLQQYAQLAANNQLSAIPSSITSNPVLNAQVLQMAKQINPSFNYNTAQGVGTAQQSNANVADTAGVAANQSVLNPAYQNYLNLQQTTQNIDQFGQLLTQTMQQGGINPTDVKFANATLAGVRNALSSGQQAIYDNTLAGLRSRVSGLLAAGGSEIPTQITSDATKILDGTLPLSALTGVLQRIQAEGNVLLGNAANVVNTAYAGTQGGSSNGSGAAPTTTNTPW